MLGYVDMPNHQAWVPNYQKSGRAHRPSTTSTGPPPGVDIDAELDTLKTTLQGIFDEYSRRTRPSSSSRLPGGSPPARDALPLPAADLQEPDPPMTETSQALPVTPRPRPAPMELRPSTREALWGYVFIGPWLIGLAAVHRRPDRSPRSSCR